jgi:hypothetical protein
VDDRAFPSRQNQFVKVGSCVSAVMRSHAGTPQGTRAGCNVFKLLINDLSFQLPTIKYVDDILVVSVASDPNNQTLQKAVATLIDWSNSNGWSINNVKNEERRKTESCNSPLQSFSSTEEYPHTFI